MCPVPVLFLPKTVRDLVTLLDLYQRKGEVVLRAGQLEELVRYCTAP